MGFEITIGKKRKAKEKKENKKERSSLLSKIPLKVYIFIILVLIIMFKPEWIMQVYFFVVKQLSVGFMQS